MRKQHDRLRWTVNALLVLTIFAWNFTVPKQTSAGEFPVSNSRELRLMKAKIRAAQFLSKATFGPTQETIDSLARRISQIGYKRATSEWIDQQFDLPPSSHVDTARAILDLDGNAENEQGIGVHNYRYQTWWHLALTGEDQLRQRVAWALSQIFVIGDSGNGFNSDDNRDVGGVQSVADWIGMSIYYDLLVDGASGNYRQLLEDVTYNPCMGVWLSSNRNRKANVAAGRFPDENYAREIMQLFSVGLYEMHQDGRLKVNEDGELIPTYDNEQIKELARLFTGFKYKNHASNSFYATRNMGEPMEVHVPEHDNNYNYSEDPNAPNSKTIFGTVLPPLPDVLTQEAAEAEIDAGLDAIANHSNVAPFICRLLIQRLVKSNPSRGYMRRVTRKFNDNGQGVRGDMRAVVKAILTDPELYRGQRVVRQRNPLRVTVLPRGTEYSRLREPINRVTSMIRALRPSSNYPSGYMMLSSAPRDELGQMPFQSPSVFNYYLPDFQPPGDLIDHTPSRRNPYDSLVAPEFQILNGVTANKTMDYFRRWTRDRYVQFSMREGTCRISFNVDDELELARDLDNLDEILRRFDLLLCNGTLSEETKTAIKDAVTIETTGRDYDNDKRLEAMLFTVLTSPDCAVEQ